MITLIKNSILYSGNCYRVLKEKKSWNAAKTFCEGEGGELASIKSSQEWTFVKGLCKKLGIVSFVTFPLKGHFVVFSK